MQIEIKERKYKAINKLGLYFKYVKSDRKNIIIYCVMDCLNKYLAKEYFINYNK